MNSITRDIPETLNEILGASGAGLLTLESLSGLKGLLSRASGEGRVDSISGFLRTLPPREGIQPARTYLEAGLARLSGDMTEAGQLYQPLCEKLNQTGEWSVLGSVAHEWLQISSAPPAARYLVRGWKKAGLGAVSESMLRDAHERLPDDHEITWCLGSCLEDSGSTREGRRLVSLALQPLAEEKDVARVEEGILRLLEAPETSILHRCVDAIDALARQGAGEEAAQLFEMILGPALAHHLAGPAWQAARRAMERHPDLTIWRPLAVRALKAFRSDLKSLDRMIEVSGLGRLAVPPSTALETLDRVLPYAPGFYVEHSGWGLGEIADNDGEFLSIHFAGRPNHRMNLKAASQVLASLPADDLKVLLAVDRQRLLRLASGDPAALVEIALRRAGGEATPADLRKLLVPQVIAAGEWSGWWKKAKDVLASDPRINGRQAFRDVYRLPDPEEMEEDDVELPPIDEPRGIDHNVDLVRSFLDHHPHAGEALKAEMLDRVKRWAERGTAKPSERARARLLLIEWDEAGRHAHIAAVERLFEEDLDLSAAGGPAEQAALLDLGLQGASRERALISGLNGRSASLREMAFRALFATPGDEPGAVYSRILTDPLGHIDALFHAAEQIGQRPSAGDPRLDDLLWPVVIGLLDVLNATGREPVRKKGLKLLEAKGPLMARMRALPPDERTESILTARLRDWRASDRVLFPILESLSASGLLAVVESVRTKKAAAHARLFQAQPAGDDLLSGPVIMTRHTFDRLTAELQRINLELKTTIPQAIKKARELGDLRENAEYEAAKLKQANAAKRLAQLDAQLEKVRILDDLAVDPEKAGPGTLVTVRDETDGSEATYWILGEGDADFGSDVISYRAPLGKTLLGRKAGESVDYAAGEEVRKLRLVAVSAKKPANPPPHIA